MQREEVLLIFVKNPVAGRVKTRLAKSVGPKKALQIYHKLLDHTREVTRPLPVDKQVWYSRFIAGSDGWSAGTYGKKLQRGSNLGAKMANAFREAFHQGYQKAVIIGSDCAELTTTVIEQAFGALENNDIVIGPSSDGGYYLLGMDSLHPWLFEHIAWSTPKVLEQTQARIQQYGLSYSMLQELNDVDHESDWNEVKERFS